MAFNLVRFQELRSKQAAVKGKEAELADTQGRLEKLGERAVTVKMALRRALEDPKSTEAAVRALYKELAEIKADREAITVRPGLKDEIAVLKVEVQQLFEELLPGKEE